MEDGTLGKGNKCVPWAAARNYTMLLLAAVAVVFVGWLMMSLKLATLICFVKQGNLSSAKNDHDS